MGALRSVRSGLSTLRRSAARRLYRAATRVVEAVPQNVVEPLETRVLMSAVNYTVPDGADHALTLSLVQVSGTPTLQLVDNGTVVASQGFAGVTSVSVTGGAGHDTLTVDLGGGNPLPSGGLVFAGGGATNRLLLENGNISNENYTTTGASSGGIKIDAGNLTYSNLGGITDLAPAVNIDFLAPAATTTVNVVNGPVVGGVQTMEVNGGASPAFLAADLGNKQHVTVDTNTGDDTLTMDVTAAPAQLSTLFLNTDQGADTVNILATPASVLTSVNGQNTLFSAHGPDEITVGNAGSVQQILGPLSLADDVWYDDITINDSADTVGRTFTYGQSSITGLAPAVISYNQSDIFTITVDAGRGGNAITVADTVVSSTNTLNTGLGNNTVVVQSVLGGSTLKINGQGGHDAVTVDVSVLTQGSLAGFQSNLGPVYVTNPGGTTALTIDASSESTNHSLTIASRWVIGLGSSSINYTLGAGSSLDVKTGLGNDAFQVNTTSIPTTLEGGGGANTYAVDLTGLALGSPLAISDGGGGQATFGGTASAATYTIGPAQIAVAGAVVNYAGLSKVTVNAIDGLDTFNVTPSASTTLNVNGGAPSGVTLNNTLNVLTTGATNVSLSETNTPTGYQGAYTFGNRQPVNFTNIQLAQQQQTASADLSLSLGAPTSVSENGALTYTFVVTNKGPGDAANVVLTDPLPAGATFQSASLGQGTYAVVNGQLVLSLGTIANGVSVSGTLTFTAGDDGTIVSNTASVSSDTPDPQTANNSASASTSVTDAMLSVTGGFAVSATEGSASATQMVAAFSDPAGAEALADYSATINWGDGSSSAGAISYNAATGLFSVVGSHLYAEQGSYALSVTVHHDSALDVSVAGTATVSDPAVAATAAGGQSAVEGAGSTFALATFTDPGGAEAVADYSATITWGDGSSSAGTITYNASTGVFAVTGTHSYADDGNYTANVAIAHETAPNASVSDAVAVSDPSVVVTAASSLSASEGSASGFALATFTDPAGAEVVGDYQASINWGDGTTSAGSITFNPATGTFTVTGTHSYAEEGSYGPLVTVMHDAAPAASAAAAVTVGDPSVAATSAGFNALRGISSGAVTLATFTDPGGAEALADYSAAINWGDGSTGAGTVTFNAATGLFSVTGSHVYAASGNYSASVTVHHDAAPDVVVTSAATISDPAVVVTGGYSFSAAEGSASASQVVASFTDPGGALPASSYLATITWGDGSSSAGTVSYNAATTTFSVAGSHLYAGEGSYSVAVTVQDGSAPAASATSVAAVSDPSVKATGGFTFSAEALVNTGSLTVATFTDPGGAEGLSHYSGSINWGDGSSSPGTISFNSSTHTFSVLGSHTYTHAGKQTLTVTIHHDAATDVSVTDTVHVNNDPPTLTNLAITSPITEGGAAHLTGAISEPVGAGTMTLLVNWGAGQGTSTYSFAEGTTHVDVTHLYKDEPAAPATSFPVSATLSNAQGTAAASTSIVVKDVPPVPAAIAGPAAGVRGQPLSFTDAFTDAGVLDTHVAKINWGDGTTSAGSVKESSGSGTITASHIFTASGVYKVALTVTDDDGASATVFKTVTVSAVLVEPDPVYGGTMLVIGGTTGSDTIQVNATKRGSNLQVMLNGAKTDVPATVGRILVYGQAGNDYIQIGHNVVAPAFLYAGNGNDTLIGGGGPDVMVGGSGNNLLMGGFSRNILIGGSGSDVLIGGNADDILIAGYTAYDHNDAALAALFNEWNRATATYTTRVNDLMHGGGLNGSYVLNSKTVFDDHALDILVGNRGLDWFIFSTGDLILDQAAGEIATKV